ncbi:MAG: GTP-binding protein [Candidatus Asgardarchaeia archaeon]
MNEERKLLNELISIGENEKTEMKRILTEKDLIEQRRRKIIAQIKYITYNHPGFFVIGIEDLKGKWDIYGLTLRELELSEKILQKICALASIRIKKKIIVKTERGLVGIYELEQISDKDKVIMININFLGRVNAGKSTLIGVLVSNRLDDGKGLKRSFLLKHPQEISKGQTADIHALFLAFDKDGKPLFMNNPLSINERRVVLERAHKIITFVDAPGHEEFTKTMIRSILGAYNQYGFVLIPADDEYKLIMNNIRKLGEAKLDSTTREHLLLMITRETPFFVIITKLDKVDERKYSLVLNVIKKTLKKVGKIPFNIRTETDLEIIAKEINHNTIVPIISVSAKNGKNIKLLIDLLRAIKPTITEKLLNKPALAYIDKIYKGIPGTNVVITATLVSGILKEGQEVKIGPDINGLFFDAKIKSLEIFNKKVTRVMAGGLFGAELKRIEPKILRRGQVIADPDFIPNPVKEFEAQILVTKHPTIIKEGYQPVLHCRTIRQAVKITKIYNKPYLVIGDNARVRIKLIRYPEIILKNDIIVLREASTKAIGHVLSLVN